MGTPGKPEKADTVRDKGLLSAAHSCSRQKVPVPTEETHSGAGVYTHPRRFVCLFTLRNWSRHISVMGHMLSGITKLHLSPLPFLLVRLRRTSVCLLMGDISSPPTSYTGQNAS